MVTCVYLLRIFATLTKELTPPEANHHCLFISSLREKNKPIVLHFGLFCCPMVTGNLPMAIQPLSNSQKGGVSTDEKT